MAEPRKLEYSAGFHFVMSTPAHSPKPRDRKAIRSHATRASAAARQFSPLRSWIAPTRKLGLRTKPKFEEAGARGIVSSIPCPQMVGSYFSGLQLPVGVEPQMIQDLVKLIELHQHGVYPYEICFDVHVVDRGWFPYMISDICCLHSMLFSVRAFIDKAPHDRLSRRAYFHYVQTLQLLRARLNEVDKTSAISDASIMVITTLAATAELIGDTTTVKNHMKGLEKIVSLRGGVRALTAHSNMQVKVCRADLTYSICSGCPPRLFSEGISWDCFIADRGLVNCSHAPHDTSLYAYLETTVETRLLNALRDLHTFSCISNLAYETTRKLSPETYNEIMISALYRLSYLSFEDDPLQALIRIGLLAFSSAIFLQRDFMGRPYDRLSNAYCNALFRLRRPAFNNLPVPLALWFSMMLHLVAQNQSSASAWHSGWLDDAVVRAGIDSWSKAREMLRSVVWVSFIHDKRGKQVFDEGVLRIKAQENSSLNKLDGLEPCHFAN